MMIYVNGVKYGKTSKNVQKVADTTIVLGKLRRASQTFTGEMAEVRVWTVRYDAEIAANYTRRMKGTEDRLLFCWPMDDGSGTTCRELVAGKTATIEKTSVVDWSDSMLPLVLSKQTLAGDQSDKLTILDGTLVAPANSDYKLADGYEMNARNSGAGVLRVEDNARLTVEGEVTMPDGSSGGFVKTGSGTLVYTGAGDVCIGGQTQNAENELAIDARGIGPTTGYHCAAVADGTLVIDKPGQTFRVYANGTGRLMTGVMYRENEERTAAHVVISNGTVLCGVVGINYIGNWTPSASDPYSTFTMEGGVVTNTGALRIGKSNSTFTLNGGTFVNPAGTAPYFVGGCTVAGVTRTVHLNGGRFVAQDFTCNKATASTDIFYYNGGIFEANNAVEQSLENDNGYRSYVSRGGAKFDCSKIPERLSVNLLLEHDPALGDEPDGGFTAVGGTVVFRCSGCTYTGDTVVETNAILAVSPNDDVAIPGRTVVRAGGRLHMTDKSTGIRTAGLVVEDGGVLSLPVFTETATNGYVTVTGGSPTFGAGYVEFVNGLYGTEQYIANGTFTVATYAGTDPDVSQLRVWALPAGRKATFAAADGRVTVTIAPDYGDAAEWTKDADGTFADAANWSQAPVSGGNVNFGTAITADRTVTTAGETVGSVGFNNADASYTLDGTGLIVGSRLAVDAGEHAIAAPLTLGGPVQAVIAPDTKLTVGDLLGEAGSLAVSGGGTLAATEAPTNALTLDGVTLDVPDGANWNLASVTIPADKTGTIGCSTGSAAVGGIGGTGSLRTTGNVNLTGLVDSFASVEAAGGRLSLSALPSTLLLGNAVLTYTGAAVASATEATLDPGSGAAAVLSTDTDLELTGRFNVASGAFVKRGAGNLTILNALSKDACVGCQDNLGSTTPVNFDCTSAAEGRVPAHGFGACTIEEGTLTIKSGTFAANGERILVGSSTVPNGQPEKSGALVVSGGKLKSIDELQIGFYNYTTDPEAEPPASKCIVSNGTLNVTSLFVGHGKTNAVIRSRPSFILENGTVNVYDRLCFGAWTFAPSADSLASIIINGGTFTYAGDLRFGDRTPSNGDQMSTYFEMNGGTVSVTNVIFGDSLSRSELHLNGGTLNARKLFGSTSAKLSRKVGYVYFNGATYAPFGDNLYSTFDCTEGGYYMQEGGLTVDLGNIGAGRYHGFDAPIARDPALGDRQDGGLTVNGAADRHFEVNSSYLRFTGPIRLEGGYCNIMPRMTNDVYVAAGANLTMRNLATGSVGDFTGTGSVTTETHQCALNVYGKFHSQGAAIDNLVVRSGAKIVSDGAAVAKAFVSATIESGATYDFKGTLPALETSFAILDVSQVPSASLSTPRRLTVSVDGVVTEDAAAGRVALSVVDGILTGTFVRTGTIVIVR